MIPPLFCDPRVMQEYGLIDRAHVEKWIADMCSEEREKLYQDICGYFSASQKLIDLLEPFIIKGAEWPVEEDEEDEDAEVAAWSLHILRVAVRDEFAPSLRFREILAHLPDTCTDSQSLTHSG